MGRTTAMAHKIDTHDDHPIKQPPHRQAQVVHKYVDKAVNEMMTEGIAQPSKSPWASPIVLVKKKDGTIRFCVNYR